VLLNLALNAVDAAGDDGAVRLRAAAEDEGVAVSVVDTGPGVPEALRARVFEPFFSSRSDGPGGLGLAISRQLIEAAGGRICVRGADCGGAEFRLWLPAEV
jgi:signal transduction histidine kinase